EMLTGHAPLTGEPQEVLARHAIDPAPKVTAARPDVPAHVEAALRKAIAKLPADRVATMTDFARALSATSTVRSIKLRRTVIAGAMLVAMVALVAAIARRPSASLRAARAAHSVAVLPINISSNPDEEA